MTPPEAWMLSNGVNPWLWPTASTQVSTFSSARDERLATLYRADRGPLSPPPRRSMPPRPYAVTKNVRQTLLRSAELFRRFRGEEELKTFVRRGTLIIRGCRFVYHFRQKASWNLRWNAASPLCSAIPYHLEISEPSGGQPIGGCVVIDDAPILDQVLAVILAVQDPDSEVEFVRRTNWFATLPRTMRDALERPALPINDNRRLAA